MTIEIKRSAEETVIRLEGKLDATTAPTLDKALKEDVTDAKNLVLDIKGLEYISSAGLRVILALQKKMQNIGTMKLINVCEAVMDVFKITGFCDFLTIE